MVAVMRVLRGPFSVASVFLISLHGISRHDVSLQDAEGFGNAVTLAQPVAQIDQLAARRAKRPRWIIRRDILQDPFAPGAHDTHLNSLARLGLA
jgi:hypothetical protein